MKQLKAILDYSLHHRNILILLFLFFLHLFFRFYGFEERHGFEWDQVDNAWAAKNILVDHKLPLVGMVAKQNSGFYIGPLYYYFVAIFYFFTSLDPVASIYIAGVTSSITFFTLYIFVKKLFSEQVALVAVFIHTVSTFIILADRTQWPVNFIAPVSLVLFYSIFRVMTGREKYILYVAFFLGLAWQLNFTAIFFFIIVLLTLPFFPRTKKAAIYSLISLPLLFLFLLPNVLYDLQNRGTSSKSLTTYLEQYYHGFHVTRMIQLAKDAFIEFAGIFDYPMIKELRYLLVPVFFLLYLLKSMSREKLLLCYLIAIWFLVPWGVFTVYKGEISNYYFSLTRPITLMMLGYITIWLYQRKQIVTKAAVFLIWGVYSIVNINSFFRPTHKSLFFHRMNVEERISRGQIIEFAPNDPESYIYYVSTEYAKNEKLSSQ
ncbi:MAG: hypothetical protein HYV40_03720 [Candidatus Levybacteria bacterium]|nr:hypothetical protein [Candidatus Levybacteria bacterium]